jgi:hypothetical protein
MPERTLLVTEERLARLVSELRERHWTGRKRYVATWMEDCRHERAKPHAVTLVLRRSGRRVHVKVGERRPEKPKRRRKRKGA